ncbi:hypothetical protein MP228_002564 [Amoeboaphelidium protococcarum]|nr:hypothetical protein MP228_002564 [Amoeboaphelidium protococcarum]
MKRAAVGSVSKDMLSIMPIGGGQEVGRSCIVLQYKGKNIMLDCGIHPAYNGISALPFFDEIDPASIDLLLITHFHLDHAASLPYFMQKTQFKGKVYMTHPTKAIYKWLLSDFVRVSTSNQDDEDMLYNEHDLALSYERIETIDFHQTIEYEDIKFTAYNAGHVLGAAMFVIEIAGTKIFYTGDYSREEDRHLMAAERPPHLIPDVMICESTYGVQTNEPRGTREKRFTGLVQEIVQRGGRCLIPAFALGRAQELLLILDEHWQSRPDLQSIPIYYASALAKKCMAVYQTYIGMMNNKIKQQFASGVNPFVFKHISNLKSIDQFDDNGPCVMMASPAMLQSGLSRELFDRWCGDKRNGVIIPGYVVEGTLAKSILLQPDEVVTRDGKRQPLRLKVEYISFSAHVDYSQNSEFIDEMRPVNLVLVHGEQHEMMRLKHALVDKYSGNKASASLRRDMKIWSPKNAEAVELYFRGEKMAKAIGSIVAQPPQEGQRMSGILVNKQFQYHLLDSEDLAEFTEVKSTMILQRQCIAYNGTFSLLQHHLEAAFGRCNSADDNSQESPSDHDQSNKPKALRVLDAVEVRQHTQGQLLLEWEGSLLNDILADAVMALIFKIESHPVSVKLTKSDHHHHHHHTDHNDSDQCHSKAVDDCIMPLHTDQYLSTPQDKIKFVHECLKAHFNKSQEDEESVLVDQEQQTAEVKTRFGTAKIDLKSLEIVECDDDVLKEQLLTLLPQVLLTAMPLGEPWSLQ